MPITYRTLKSVIMCGQKTYYAKHFILQSKLMKMPPSIIGVDRKTI